MDPASEDPDDAVVVYRTVRARDLDAPREALLASGVPCVSAWHPTSVPAGKVTAGVLVAGEGELRVPRAQLEAARAALSAYEAAAESRIRAHLRLLPGQLLRGAAAVLICVLLATLLGAGTSPWVLLALGVACAVLYLAAYLARVRDRGDGPAHEAPSRPPRARAPRWFGRSDGPDQER